MRIYLCMCMCTFPTQVVAKIRLKELEKQLAAVEEKAGVITSPRNEKEIVQRGHNYLEQVG